MQPQTLYIVERHYGKLGNEWTGDNLRTRAQLVADIASGQLECVTRIIEISLDVPDCGRWRDVTEDVARDVHELLRTRGCGCPSTLVDFIDEHVGVAEAAKLDYRAGVE